MNEEHEQAILYRHSEKKLIAICVTASEEFEDAFTALLVAKKSFDVTQTEMEVSTATATKVQHAEDELDVALESVCEARTRRHEALIALSQRHDESS